MAMFGTRDGGRRLNPFARSLFFAAVFALLVALFFRTDALSAQTPPHEVETLPQATPAANNTANSAATPESVETVDPIFAPLMNRPQLSTGAETGTERSVADLLKKTTDPKVRRQRLDDYWELVERLALYNIASTAANDVEACVARHQNGQIPQNTVALLVSARRVAAQEKKSAELGFIETQYRFAAQNRLGLGTSSGEINPKDLVFPSDAPTMAPYNTRFDEISKTRRLSLDARLYHVTLPHLYDAVVARRNETTETLAAFAALHKMSNSSDEMVLAALDRHTAAKRNLVRAVIVYNQTIAAYVAETVGGNIQGDRLLMSYNQPAVSHDIPRLARQPQTVGTKKTGNKTTFAVPKKNAPDPKNLTFHESNRERPAPASDVQPAPNTPPSAPFKMPSDPFSTPIDSFRFPDPLPNNADPASPLPARPTNGDPAQSGQTNGEPSDELIIRGQAPEASDGGLQLPSDAPFPALPTETPPANPPATPPADGQTPPANPPAAPPADGQTPPANPPAAPPAGGQTPPTGPGNPPNSSVPDGILGNGLGLPPAGNTVQTPTPTTLPPGAEPNPGESPQNAPGAVQPAAPPNATEPSAAAAPKEEEPVYTPEQLRQIQQLAATLFLVDPSKSGGGDSSIIETPLTLHDTLSQISETRTRLTAVELYWELRVEIARLDIERKTLASAESLYESLKSQPSSPEIDALLGTCRAATAAGTARIAETRAAVRAAQVSLMKQIGQTPEAGWPIPSSPPCLGPYRLESGHASLRNFPLLIESVMIPEKIAAVRDDGIGLGAPEALFAPETGGIKSLDDAYLYLKTLDNKRLAAIGWLTAVESLNNSIARYVAAFSETPLPAKTFADCLIGPEEN